jgi:hypothetical protein
VPLPELKVIVSKNSRKVRICIVNNSNSNDSTGYNSNALIRSYGPDLDSNDSEELAYQELVEYMDRRYRK